MSSALVLTFSQVSDCHSQSQLLYYRWFIVNQFIFAPSPLSSGPGILFPYARFSLGKGRGCLSWTASGFVNVRFAHTASYRKFYLVQLMQVFCHPHVDHICLTYFVLQRQLSHLNSSELHHHQVQNSNNSNSLTTELTNQHGGRKDNTIILTNGQLAISTTTGEAQV
jgi:hypothetical protein